MARRKRFSKRKPMPVIITKKRRKRGPRTTNLLKSKTLMKLRYVDAVSINPAATNVLAHVYRCNGLNDPDLTSSGHSPLLFNNMEEYYEQYRVISSTIKVTPITTSTSNVVPGYFGVFKTPLSTNMAGYTLGTSVIEDSRLKGSWGLHLGTSSALNVNGGTRSGRQKSLSFNAKRDLSKDAANLAQLTAADPSDGFDYYFQVWCGSILANDPGSLSFLVQIDYLVEFTSPRVITPSS